MARATTLVILLLVAACGDQTPDQEAGTAMAPPSTAAEEACFNLGSCRLLERPDAPRAYVVERDDENRISALTLDGMPLAEVLRALDPQQAPLVGAELLPAGRYAVVPRRYPVRADRLFADLLEGIARTWGLKVRHVDRTGTVQVLTCTEVRPPFYRGTTGGSAILTTATQVQFLNVSAAELTAWLGEHTGIPIPVAFPGERLSGVIDRSEEPAVIISLFERAGFAMVQQARTTRELVVTRP